MLLASEVEKILREIFRLADLQKKLTGFCIGNTRKINETGMYFSPIRITSKLIAGSAIVYSVDQAAEIVKIVDGRVDYIFVDTEKKISKELFDSENIGNVERAVREVASKSKILTYKGNDLTVDSIENFVVQLLSTHPRGLGGKKAVIIGAGNVGSKLGLKLVERGMNVVLNRRNKEQLDAIVNAINYIKPKETLALVESGYDSFESAKKAHLLVGLTQGTQVITAEMIDVLANGAIVFDGGKGCCTEAAIDLARQRNIPIYRADIRAGFEGHIAVAMETEAIALNTLGRKMIRGVPVVSAGLLGYFEEVVVDNIKNPHSVLGIANGLGDFIRVLNEKQLERLHIVTSYIQTIRRL